MISRPGSFVGASPPDPDGTVDRRDLSLFAQETAQRLFDPLESRYLAMRNRTGEWTLGIVGRTGDTEPDGRLVTLVVNGEQLLETTTSPTDDHQHSAGHRIEGSAVAETLEIES